MKSLTLRASVALACALSLAACGGKSGNLLLSGTVSGLTKPNLQLQNKSGPLLDVQPGATSFVFNELIGNDEDFDVEIARQPQGAVCKLDNNKGKSGAYNITSVFVTCATNTYDLGGKISGDATGLVLVNGADRLAITSARTDFTMSKVADGAPYGITVLTQPAGRTCSVQNGVGTMGSAPVDTILVTCA